MAGISSDREERFTLKALTTVELEALIFAATSHDDLDLDYLNALLDEYGTREEVPTMSTERAQELFDERILPLMQSGDKAKKIRNRATKSRGRRTLRASIIAAVIAALLIGGSLTALAVGTDFFDVLFDWGREHLTFSMSYGDAIMPTDAAREHIEVAEELKPLQEALEERGITASLLPTYFPEGYEALEPEIYDDKLVSSLSFPFQKDDDLIFFVFHWFTTGNVEGAHEKDSENPVIYDVNDTTYYITTNMGKYIASWTCGAVACTISGVCDEAEIYKMLDSIP